jgi:hypothetical protein
LKDYNLRIGMILFQTYILKIIIFVTCLRDLELCANTC